MCWVFLTYLEAELLSKIRSSLIYPFFILILLGLVGTLMMTFVIPRMTEMLIEAGADLPLSTKILIFISNFLKNYIIHLFLIAFELFG